MIQIDIQPIPNQSFSVRLGGRIYNITLKETRGVMSVTIVRDGVTLISGARVCAGSAMISYQYQEDGNFLIDTLNQQLPDYREFGNSQFMYYLTADEVAALRGA